VFWRLTGLDASERAEQAETIRDGLESMRGVVPGLLETEVGRNVHDADDHFDVVLNALFTDQAAIIAYQQHPLHTAAIAPTPMSKVPRGIKFAVFYTELHNRLLRPLMAAGQAQAPPELRQAQDVISQHVDDYISRARIGKAVTVSVAAIAVAVLWLGCFRPVSRNRHAGSVDTRIVDLLGWPVRE
jgi:hypothetical protein